MTDLHLVGTIGSSKRSRTDKSHFSVLVQSATYIETTATFKLAVISTCLAEGQHMLPADIRSRRF